MFMNNKNNTEFKVRAYSKKELALMYFPTAGSPHTAVNHLMAWVRRCTPLWEALQQMGYQRTAKYLTSREVAKIIEYLGEP